MVRHIAVVFLVGGCGETVLIMLDGARDGVDGGRIETGHGSSSLPDGGVGTSSSSSGTSGVVIEDPPDAGCDQLCPAAGGTCAKDGTCKIACTACRGVVCPPRLRCEVTCIGPNSCTDLDCGRASNCKVSCKGGNNCAGIRCSSADRCEIHCENENACTGVIATQGKNTSIKCVGAKACVASIICCAEECSFECPGDNCANGLCCGPSTKSCKGEKSAQTCPAVACSGS